jgi:hypothetical protein
MSLSRLVYFSEIAIAATERDWRIEELQKVAVTENRRRHLTGALIYDDCWFAQALEGEIQFVEEIFARIRRDTRHANINVLSNAVVPERLFGKWSMGFAARTLKTEPLFGLHWFNATRTPSIMSEKSLLKLMIELGQQGYLDSGHEMVSGEPENTPARPTRPDAHDDTGPRLPCAGTPVDVGAPEFGRRQTPSAEHI